MVLRKKSPSLKDVAEGKEVVVGGLLSSVRITVVRNGRSAGKKMAILSLQDRIGNIDCVIFSDAYQRCAHLLQQDSVVLVVGRFGSIAGRIAATRR